MPVRVKKTSQTKAQSPGSDSIRTEALADMHLHSGIGWLYLPAEINQDAARRRMEREWWQFEFASARARASWRLPRPRKLPAA
jgi:hypothetical protein